MNIISSLNVKKITSEIKYEDILDLTKVLNITFSSPDKHQRQFLDWKPNVMEYCSVSRFYVCDFADLN
jgi:hypothetical protein